MADFLIAWPIVGGLLLICCLCCAGLAYLDNDRSGCRSCFRAGAFALIWPVSIPVALLMGLYKVYCFAFRGGRR